MVELTARIALESMMAATADDATPIIRRLARIQARTVLDQTKATPDAAASTSTAIAVALQKSVMLELVDNGVWSLRFNFGKGDDARERMRAAASIIATAPKAAPTPDAAATECPATPDGRHQVDTSMESGPNNCFHCEAKMGTNDAR